MMHKLLIIVLLLAKTLSAADKAVHSNTVPPYLAHILDQHYQTIKQAELPSTFDFLPGWYLKSSARSRLEGRDAIVRAIKELNKTDLFVVPQKYLYNGPDNQQYVVAQAVQKQHSTCGVDDIKEVIRVAKRSGWYDCHPSNFLRTPDNKIVIIDTESLVDPERLANPYQLKFIIVNQCLKPAAASMFTKQALQYLKDKHTKYIEWPHADRVETYLAMKEKKNRYKRITGCLHELMGNL